MPHKPKPSNQPTPASEQRRLLFLQGAQDTSTIADLDPKPEPFVQAILLLLAEGATVSLRPGNGGRSVGIGGYHGEERLPTKWLYDNEELDDWASLIIRNLGGRKGVAD